MLAIHDQDAAAQFPIGNRLCTDMPTQELGGDACLVRAEVSPEARRKLGAGARELARLPDTPSLGSGSKQAASLVRPMQLPVDLGATIERRRIVLHEWPRL